MITIFIFYGSIVFFIVTSLVLWIRFLKFPIPLRWEIYRDNPIYDISEPKLKRYDKSRYFASTFIDILFLRNYYRNQKGFWLPLFAFHLGIYLLLVWHIWLLASAIFEFGVNPDIGLILGHTATGIAFIGGVSILGQRIFNKRLREYYPTLHYIKWIFVLAILVQAYLTIDIYFDNNMAEVMLYVEKQLAFDWAYKINSPPATSLHVLLASAWLVYMPFSHAKRLLFKHYHELRWDYVPNTRNCPLERKISINLTRPVSWSAAHISPARTWGSLLENIIDGKRSADNV